MATDWTIQEALELLAALGAYSAALMDARKKAVALKALEDGRTLPATYNRVTTNELGQLQTVADREQAQADWIMARLARVLES